ncbi:MAG TPA: exopolysaccharide biosynthesis protein [Baekduia sp.]|nr:exopolysaccharide biosynthesis protein [Baekduia sp.]
MSDDPPIAGRPRPTGPSTSQQLEDWLRSDGDKTLEALIEVFEEKSFALLFVLLLGVPALPMPTGGATHVFEVIAILLAVQLVLGRDTIWLPERWRRIELAGDKRERFLAALLRMTRRLERVSRPRLTFLFGHRASNAVFGLLVAGGSLAAFLAPPFTGLDTLPALSVVLLSLAVLLEDAVGVVVALVVGVTGVALEIFVGGKALEGLGDLL